MSSGIKSSHRDMTGQFRPVGVGCADMRRSWLCGHKAHSGKKRAGLLWKCAKCMESKT
jgi:hypothetical protein